MAYTVGQTEVDVFPNAKGWDSALASQIDPQVEAIGKRIGDQLANDVRDGIRRGLIEAKAGTSPTVKLDVDTAGATADLLRFRAEADAIAADTGDESGGLLAQGMRNGFMRNSPLIAAAVAGGLVLGAPAVIAGAGVLFAGIAAVAVHSNAQVQAAFTATKTAIESTFTDAAQVTVPFFVSAIGRIGAAVQSLGPQLHAAFAAMGGPIDSLTTGLISMANNAMPGLVAAVQAAGPVFQGLSSLMASIGSGLGQMFQILSQHSAAAAQVFSSLGSVVGSLLPILGQLVGAGAELGAAVLPPLASILGVVEHVLSAIAPVLPIVAAGFLAFKGAQLASGYLDGFAQKLALASYSSSSFAGVAGKASSAISGISAALPVVGVLVGALGAAMEAGSSQIDSWGKSLLDGGSAADQAAASMQHIDSVTQAGLGGLHSWGDVWDRMKALTEGTTDAQNKGADAAQRLYSAMSPLGQAQQDVTRTQNDYLTAVGKWGASSGQAIGASAAYRDAQQHLADVQGTLEQATQGVTQAMIDQADEALAAIDANFGLQHAQNQQRDAEASLAQAIKDHGSASVQAHDASQAYIESIYRTSEAAAKLAADQSGLKAGTLEYKNVLDSQLLASLEQVRGTLSGPAAAAVDGFIATLKNAGVTSDTTGQKLDDLGQKKPTPTVDLNKGPFDSKLLQAQGDMSDLAAQQPTPKANLNKLPFDINASALSNTLTWLDNFHVFPSATLVDMASANLARIQRGLDGLQSKTITVTTYNRIVSTGSAGLGGSALMQANGGIVKMFADGGFNPMSANVAQVVAPGTKRIIGDNPTSDEAYIPINNSARSLAILAQTANRMGHPLTGAGAGAKTDARSYSFQISGAADPVSLLRLVQDSQRDAEFLHG